MCHRRQTAAVAAELVIAVSLESPVFGKTDFAAVDTTRELGSDYKSLDS